MTTVSSSLNLGMYLSPRVISASFRGLKRHITLTPHSAASAMASAAPPASVYTAPSVPKGRFRDLQWGLVGLVCFPLQLVEDFPVLKKECHICVQRNSAVGKFLQLFSRCAGRPSSEPPPLRHGQSGQTAALRLRLELGLRWSLQASSPRGCGIDSRAETWRFYQVVSGGGGLSGELSALQRHRVRGGCARTQPHRPLPVIVARARTIPRRVPSPHISTTITELVTCTSTQPALIFYESSYFFIFKSTVYCISLEFLKYTVQISVKSYILGKLEYLITFIFVINLHLWKCKHFSCK